ncbi:hypothetical protein ASG48_10430 [Aurantimonas sp. Leaf443]|nr:hypothetical protein ASG48_10430 [Aurantimonas sp. Leaf443]
MIVVHSLAYSRAVRVVWLLEEIGTPYDLRTYDRTEAYRAPETLKALHPLGKSPVIEDDGLVLAESSAVLRYVNEHYAGGRFAPEPGTQDHARHDEWLDGAEGSFARSIIASFWAARSGAEMEARMRDELARNMAYLNAVLSERRYLMGDGLTLADIQFAYLLAMAEKTGALAPYADVLTYWHRLSREPALRRALAKTGPMMPERL